MRLLSINNRPWIDLILIVFINLLPIHKRKYNLYLGILLVMSNHYLPSSSRQIIHYPPFIITSTVKNRQQHIFIDCRGRKCLSNTSWRWIIQKMQLMPQTRLELINHHIWHDILFFSLPEEICRTGIVIQKWHGPTIINTNKVSEQSLTE